jgi:hypothetical protein
MSIFTLNDFMRKSHLYAFSFFLIVAFSFTSSSFAQAPSKQNATVSDTLVSAQVIFGIPDWATHDEWDGDQILYCGVTITLKDGRSFKAVQEHRNGPVGHGRAIYLILPFTKKEMKQITFDNVQTIYIEMSDHPGSNHDADASRCIYREETVLYFVSGKIIGTGYPIDAEKMLPLGKYYVQSRRTERSAFNYEKAQLLHETIQ